MPIYEYVCDDCGTRYERIVMNGNAKISCPKCSSAKGTIQLSVFAAHGAKSAGGPAASADSGPAGGCCGGACGCRN
jgi:putative FmdB family regulatory protein